MGEIQTKSLFFVSKIYKLHRNFEAIYLPIYIFTVEHIALHIESIIAVIFVFLKNICL